MVPDTLEVTNKGIKVDFRVHVLLENDFFLAMPSLTGFRRDLSPGMSAHFAARGNPCRKHLKL